MPGRLVMDQHGVPAPPDLDKQPPAPSPRKQSVHPATAPGSHIPDRPLPHGAPVQAPPTANGHTHAAAAAAAPAPAADLPPPPPLDGSWRDSASNKSLGVLIERLAQQCFGDLNDTLTRMSDMPPPQPAPANGAAPPPADASDASLSRKRALMDFAHNQRDRFIKTLVLSDWSRNADDMARLIDLKVWQSRQADQQRHAINFIHKLRQDMRTAKMPNPNIEAALELLSTGKASQLPHLGYLPPRPLSANQVLNLLRRMNVALNTRLNLHHDLPPHFNLFSVANGRATLTVPGEFEVDVSVADEDAATPFYFIDMRFLFSPTPSLSDDGLRRHLEERANGALLAGGLQRCYDFLHGYVLAYKVNALRAQAVQLLRDKWFDCLQPEMHRQIFTLQYWKGQRAPKSWIEIAVISGKHQASSSRVPPTPRNSFRWFRHGQEVPDHGIGVDWQHLHLETILAAVTAKHAHWALRIVRERFQVLAGPHSKVDVQLKSSDTDPDHCFLTLSLPGLPRPTTVRLEPITGSMSVSPPNRNAQAAEKYLNRTADADPARSLAEVLTRSVQDRLALTARLAGWSPLDISQVMVRPELKPVLGSDAIRRSLYKCSTGWGEPWALYVTLALSGEKWFVVRIDDKLEGERRVRVMTTARRLDLTDSLVEMTPAALRRVQTVAEAEVSFAVLIRELDDSQHDYRTKPTRLLTDNNAEAGSKLAIYFSPTPRKQSATRGSMRAFTFASWIKLASSSVPSLDGTGEVQHEIRLSVDPGEMQHLQQHLMSSVRTHDIAINADGGLGLRLRSAFGQPFLKRIQGYLLRCHRINTFLGVLQQNHHGCTHVSLSKIAFEYSDTPALGAEVTFGLSARTCTLKFTPVDSNPHQRLRTLLEKSFNRDEDLARLSVNLTATLPLLQTLDQLELADSSGRSVAIHPRNISDTMLSYTTPLPTCQFLITIAQQHDPATRTKQVRYRCKPVVDGIGHALMEALRAFSQTAGEHWWGDQVGGFGCGKTGIDEAFGKLDETIRRFEGTADGTTKTPSPAQPGRQDSRDGGVGQDVIELD